MVFAADLLGQFSRIEQQQAGRAFAMRLGLEGRGKKSYPDDESPASVARQATVYGVLFCCIGIVALIPIGAALLLVLLSLAPGLPENAMALWWIGTLGACVGTAIYAIRRYRQIDRYFAERHADALHRWFFRPGRVPGEEPREQVPAGSSRTLMDEDATEIPADLATQLTRREQYRVRTLLATSPGRDARTTVRAGVSGAKRDIAIPFFGASCGLASMLFIDPALWWAVAAAITALAGSLVLVLASRRRRWVDEWFDRHGSAER